MDKHTGKSTFMLHIDKNHDHNDHDRDDVISWNDSLDITHNRVKIKDNEIKRWADQEDWPDDP